MSSQWLDEHLETFVRPYLGNIPDVSQNSYWVGKITPQVIRALKALWEVGKRKSDGRPILLAGRDVWLFEVLAQLEGFPHTTFRPDISSYSRVHPSLKGKYCDHYLIDSGNKGTIPYHLGIDNYGLVYASGAGPSPAASANWNVEAIKANRQKHQLFPHQLAGGISFGLYNTLEGVSKYWTQAKVTFVGTSNTPDKIEQHLSNETEFREAAMVTRHLASWC